jgi:hypothetical protein
MLAFTDPLSDDDIGANAVISAAEPVFAVVFAVDVALLHAHSGFHQYWTGPEWKWNVADFVVVVSGLVGLLPGVDANFGVLRMVRILRPLKTLSKVESIKHVRSHHTVFTATPLSGVTKLIVHLGPILFCRQVVVALGRSLPGLANVFAMVCFVIFVYGLFGLKFWIGALEGRCVNKMGGNGAKAF